jgi:putative ABC transport system ATP-binding protein
MNIDARELTLIFDGEKDTMTVAVDNLDITVRENELMGIMGPSGSGKSSLLYLLSGLKKPTSGSVFYDDKDILLLGENEMDAIRRDRFGFIFQRHYLISHLTVLENILLPLRTISGQDTEYALSLMDEVGIRKCRDKKPHEVSVGERQKAAVLRALINKPQILFADEPTASLDIDSAMGIMELLEKCAKDAGIVVVTHDYKILKNAGRIVHMRDGKLI